MPLNLDINCASPSECMAAVPHSINGEAYRIDGYSGGSPSPNATTARFLMQATFGPTMATIHQLVGEGEQQTSDNIKAWLDEQMHLPPTLHRQYYRKRANPRLNTALPTGGVRQACEVGSRWHSFALTKEDKGKTLELSASALSVDGSVRTEAVNSTSNLTFSYVICSVVEEVGGTVRMGTNCAMSMPNPPILLTAPDPSFTHVGEASLQQIKPGVYILAAPIPSCVAIHLQYNPSEYLRVDLRLKLAENTLSSPAAVLIDHPLSCPTVPRNFVNKASCILSNACASIKFTSVRLELNETTLANVFHANGKIVYYVQGLRLEDDGFSALHSPCTGRSRWRMTTGACPSDTPLGGTTRSSLVCGIMLKVGRGLCAAACICAVS